MVRVPAKRAALLSALILVSELACAASDGGPGGSSKMRVVRDGGSVAVEAGETIDLVVTRPVAAAFELRYEWPPAPSIEGDAVRFLRVRVEGPPPDVDGGVTTHHYELEAVKPGTARVTLVPKLAGEAVAPAPRVLAVTVRAAPAP